MCLKYEELMASTSHQNLHSWLASAFCTEHYSEPPARQLLAIPATGSVDSALAGSCLAGDSTYPGDHA